jgi:hypothetical protein
VRVGPLSRASLQVADALGGQAGSRSQLLLRKTRSLPQPPQLSAERDILPSDHVVRSYLVMTLRTFPQVRGIVADGTGNRHL